MLWYYAQAYTCTVSVAMVQSCICVCTKCFIIFFVPFSTIYTYIYICIYCRYMYDGSCLGLSTSVQKGVKDKAFLINGKDIMETRQCTVCHAHYATIILQPLERRLKTRLYIESYPIVIICVSGFFSFLSVIRIYLYSGDKWTLLHSIRSKKMSNGECIEKYSHYSLSFHKVTVLFLWSHFHFISPLHWLAHFYFLLYAKEKY